MIILTIAIISFIVVFTNYNFKFSFNSEGTAYWDNILVLIWLYIVMLLLAWILKFLWIAEINWRVFLMFIYGIWFIPLIVLFLGDLLKIIINSFNKFIKWILFINIPELKDNDFLLNKIISTIFIIMLPLHLITTSTNIFTIILSLWFYLPALFFWIIMIYIIYKSYIRYQLKHLYKEYKFKGDTVVSSRIKAELKDSNINKMVALLREIA